MTPKSEFTIAADVGGEGNPARLTIAITGSVCRIEDLQLALLAEVSRWKKTSPKAKSKKPCGCKDAR